jgi:SNF2 family DNA or RNA helicase
MWCHLSMSLLELRPYQVECIRKAIARESMLMAMVMGSGKTIASAAAIRKLRRMGEVESGVVFALNSTKWQWVREIAKVDPCATIQVVDGTRQQRTKAIRTSDRYNYTILNYECLVNDWKIIQAYLAIDFIVLDEATAIKSFVAKRAKRAKMMASHTPYRFALSGQPIENRPEELFSIMEFVDPTVLGDFWKFDRTFIERDHWGKPKRYKNLNLLRQLMEPAMFRRSRKDIAEWLPDKIEHEMPVKLDPFCMRLHDHVKNDLLEALDRAIEAGIMGGFNVISHYGKSANNSHANHIRGEVMARLLAMRMLSSHPALLLHSADQFDDPESAQGSQYASDLKAVGALNNIPTDHAKLDALLETVDEILAEDPKHKVVVFSYFKPMLAIIGAKLKARHIGFTTITGDVKAADRDTRIVRFNTDPSCRVFLSSDAGAYGVDLNQGSHLVCYDLPWSAGVLLQRVSRIDRTSSGFPSINIIYLYGANTIEQRMYEQLAQKMAVADAFIDGQFDAATGSLPLDLSSLREFLLGL